ncbi:hypothetical protein K470DRAFT_207234, partial [Piedraia hortae CBS 480.64]
TTPTTVQNLPPVQNLTPLQQSMHQKLISARFRHLNQTLYTTPSTTSLSLFTSNPQIYNDYHTGFRQQVALWPENPVDIYIHTLSNLRKPRGRDVVIADLGCGDARIAAAMAEKKGVKVLSYDLVASAPGVIQADISSLPLPGGSVDLCIFCLALMGTNWVSFVEEANKVLRMKGEVWVAEIKSRFARRGRGRVEHSVGKKRKTTKGDDDDDDDDEEVLRTEVDGVDAPEETDVGPFIDVFRRRGFTLKEGSVDLRNKMFVRMEFIKTGLPSTGDVDPDEERKVLKPCLYKTR